MKITERPRATQASRVADPRTGAARVHRWLDSDRMWLLDQLMRGEVPLPGGHCRAPLSALEQRLIRTYLGTGEAPEGWRAALLDAIALEIKRVQERNGASACGDVRRTSAERRRYEAAVEALRAELAAAAVDARRTGWQSLLDELRAGLLRLNGMRDRLHAEDHSAMGVDEVLFPIVTRSKVRRRREWLRGLVVRAFPAGVLALVLLAGWHGYEAIGELLEAGPSAHRARVELGVEPGP